MTQLKDIKNQIKEFIKDDTQKRIEIDVPEGFKVSSVVNPVTLSFRKLLNFMQHWTVPSNYKNWLINVMGARIGKDVCLAHYLYFDPYFPELIHLGKGTLVGGLSSFISHELKDNKLILGRVDVKDKVLCAGFTTIYPGVTVNRYVITGMRCNIRQDCPERGFVVANDRLIKQWSDEEVERFFRDSRTLPDYYKQFHKKTRDFRKDKNMKKLTIPYDGKRLNAGDEWYLCRPVIKVLYNSAFVEFAKIVPWNWLRIFLYRLMGVKLGKNVKLGKDVIIDHLYGDLHKIGNNVRLDDGCYIDGHSYTIAESVFGRVVIGDNSHLEPGVHVMCGTNIGSNCTVKAKSSVLKDIPDGETWGGVPAKPLEPAIK